MAALHLSRLLASLFPRRRRQVASAFAGPGILVVLDMRHHTQEVDDPGYQPFRKSNSPDGAVLIAANIENHAIADAIRGVECVPQFAEIAPTGCKDDLVPPEKKGPGIVMPLLLPENPEGSL